MCSIEDPEQNSPYTEVIYTQPPWLGKLQEDMVLEPRRIELQDLDGYPYFVTVGGVFDGISTSEHGLPGFLGSRFARDTFAAALDEGFQDVEKISRGVLAFRLNRLIKGNMVNVNRIISDRGFKETTATVCYAIEYPGCYWVSGVSVGDSRVRVVEKNNDELACRILTLDGGDSILTFEVLLKSKLEEKNIFGKKADDFVRNMLIQFQEFSSISGNTTGNYEFKLDNKVLLTVDLLEYHLTSNFIGSILGYDVQNGINFRRAGFRTIVQKGSVLTIETDGSYHNLPSDLLASVVGDFLTGERDISKLKDRLLETIYSGKRLALDDISTVIIHLP